jgi:glucose uptake protein GlcU
MDQNLSDLGFSFSLSSIIASILFGIIGWWMFKTAKRRDNTKVVWIGVALMIYPYFVDNTKLIWLIGFALCGLAYYYRWD